MRYHDWILTQLRKERLHHQLPLDLPPTEAELQLHVPRPKEVRDDL